MEIQSNLPEQLTTLKLKGKELRFRVLRGIALEDKAWSETHISSSRNGYGQVASVQGRSVTKRECWIRLENGKDRVIALPDNTSFSVREGQAVSLVCMHSPHLEKDTSYYLALVNHASDKWVQLEQREIVRRLAGVDGGGAQALANLFVLATLGIGAIFLMIYNRSVHSNYVAPIRQHLQQIAKWCFQR